MPNGSCPRSVGSPRTFGPDDTGSVRPSGEPEMTDRFAVWHEVTALDVAA
jgi:hypothetical protein